MAMPPPAGTTTSPLATLLSPQPSNSRSSSSLPEVVLLQARLNTHLPLVRSLLRASLASKHHVLLVTFDVPGAFFSPLVEERVTLLDYSGLVLGYELDGAGKGDVTEEALAAARARAYLASRPQYQSLTPRAVPKGPATIALIGLDTFSQDATPVRAYTLVKALLSLLSTHPTSRLVLALSSGSPLAPLFISPSFSPDLTHLLPYPPSILQHLATNFLTLPPPFGPGQKFWALFTGAAERGEGVTPRTVRVEEGLLESRVRKRGRVHRELGGWKEVDVGPGAGACAWEELGGMQEMVNGLLRTGQVQASTATSDPTADLPFNLALTPAQSAARASVPLPYAHAGKPPPQGEIIYEPDSGDDVDDDDPDEDLDI
ncbi:hypothetical protein CALVIDRAFT_599037 [Calocera viscosa TUFC12733]|uniref:Elongator complex protein 5 n=1 Tax=Calocera viscosa (strain TUFC12733) TaxID=1330018 RepID=A0A167LEA3_CALVF|nr:hypothetical protein CALVIDRAFT_599037 [Calocera viscosa TUFC12733]